MTSRIDGAFARPLCCEAISLVAAAKLLGACGHRVLAAGAGEKGRRRELYGAETLIKRHAAW